MNLFLWRHAEAEETSPDLSRVLTDTGRTQAARVGRWVRRAIQADAEILVSPACRARQTADGLGLPYRIAEPLAPGACLPEVFQALGLDDPAQLEKRQSVVAVGHQPWLGALAAQLVSGRPGAWSVRKCQVWWLMWRARSGEGQWTVRAVIDADVL